MARFNFDFPTRISLTTRNSSLLPEMVFPYPPMFYSMDKSKNEIRVLREVEDEVKDLIRRYALLYPESVEGRETGAYISYRCLIHDEDSNVTRGILERLGYTIYESNFTAYSIYWIELKTRGEMRKKR
ncbi:hypothetical protein ACQKJG_17880 [Priestia megaterium]|uniref:hypothetical protein n=1 Tax=Priestia megaterium TaxID=1404 RepID=UPI003CFD0F6D